MHNKNRTLKTQRVANTSRFSKRIGSTVYNVEVFFNEESRETFKDKALRLAKNDLNLKTICDKIQLPQTGQLLEGGSSS